MKKKHNIHFLNELLANFSVMYVKLHRYHWYVQGKHFFSLHEKFEELYKSFANDIDEVAERILMIDGKPYATMEKYLKATTLKEATADDKEDEMISQLIMDFEHLVIGIRDKGIPYASELQDEPTIDMLIGYQGKFEKTIWMLKAHSS